MQGSKIIQWIINVWQIKATVNCSFLKLGHHHRNAQMISPFQVLLALKAVNCTELAA